MNGEERAVDVSRETPLLFVLRNDLGLTGAKLGCGLEQCHACAVIADGETVTTCATAVEQFVGRSITTVEGLSPNGSLHPVQQAFVAEQAAQCGYCIPGMVVATVALLERTPHPTDDEIRSALDPHLCRCGTHPRIVNAVRRAATA